jgi:hypothetical protein
MKRYLFRNNFDKLFTSIELCFKNEFYTSALIILYSIIDFLAFCNLPENKNEVSKRDFLLWVDKYLLPESLLKCNSLDLYSARCSLLHTSGSDLGYLELKKQEKFIILLG